MRVTYLFLWLLLVGYAGFILWTYPQLLNDTVLQQLMAMEMNDPLVSSLFFLMGLLPLLFLLYALRYHHRFWTLFPIYLSFGIGAFSVLPYLAFLDEPHERPFRERHFIKLVRSPYLYSILSIVTVLLFFYGLIFGSFVHYLELIQSSPFVAIMSADFLILTLLPYAIINLDQKKIDFPVVYGIPWIGFIVYLYQFYQHLPKQTPAS